MLRRHCDALERDPATIEVTQLSTVLVGDDQAAVRAAVERLRPKRMSAERFAERVNAGTVDQHLGRFEELGRAGVHTAIVSLPDVEDPESIARFLMLDARFPRSVAFCLGELEDAILDLISMDAMAPNPAPLVSVTPPSTGSTTPVM